MSHSEISISLREEEDRHDKKADEQKNKEAEAAVGEHVLPKRAADLYVAGHRMTPEQLLQKQRHRHQQSEKCEAPQPSHEINPTVLNAILPANRGAEHNGIGGVP